jgi:hypothetical protein
MEQEKKVWKLELTSMELSILQVAFDKFQQNYTGEVFQNRLINTFEELYSYKLISEIKNESL